MIYACFAIGILFKLVSEVQKKQLIQNWSKKLLSILNIQLKVVTPPHASLDHSLIVANHISWLDIFVLNSIRPMRFISKSEVRDWPLIGWFAEKSGTLFIAREKRSDTVRLVQIAAEALEQGQQIAFFPEGTTTDGTKLKPFSTALLQTAIKVNGSIQPAAIRYRDSKNAISMGAIFVDDMSIVDSLLRMFKQPVTIAEITFTEAIPVKNKTRRELGAEAEKAIAQTLALPLPDRELEKPVYLPNEYTKDSHPTNNLNPAQEDFAEPASPALTNAHK
jgi:1-acyl-sn-glycerol-3-phosphate acyltransferase